MKSHLLGAVCVSFLFYNPLTAQAVNVPMSDGFDYPIGPRIPGAVTEVADGDGWKNDQNFGDKNTTVSPGNIRYHLGEDWNQNYNAAAGEDCNIDEGEYVYAVSNGLVVFAGFKSKSWGNLVIIQHRLTSGEYGGAVASLYAHLDSVMAKNGHIKRGDKIGTVGRTGKLSGEKCAHLHFELRSDEEIGASTGYSSAPKPGGWLDPSEFIDPRRTLKAARTGPSLYVHDGGGRLGVVDVASGMVTLIGNMGVIMTDIAFAPNGELYAISFSNLYRLNLATAAPTLIGSHGIPGGNGLVFGSDSTLYGAGNSSRMLFTINPQTGNSTVFGDMGYFSAGDLVFFNQKMYLASTTNELVFVDLGNIGVGTPIGPFGFTNVFGLATADDGVMYGTANLDVFSVNTATGNGMLVSNYVGQAMTQSYGSSFFAEAGAQTLPLVSSVLPASRSVQVGRSATAFSAVINTGSQTAVNCIIAPRSIVPGGFTFQSTDPVTNQTTGTPNSPVDILPGAIRSFVVAFTPTSELQPTEVEFNIGCENTELASTQMGVNTFLLSASVDPVPDIMAMVATIGGNGIVDVRDNSDAGVRSGVFAVATANVGVASSITVSIDTGRANKLPISVALCETDPLTSLCVNPQKPGNYVTTDIQAGETPTFGVFINAQGLVPFDPGVNRVNVRFRDQSGQIRGSTSVAIQTQ